jgi:hypothetical protein
MRRWWCEQAWPARPEGLRRPARAARTTGRTRSHRGTRRAWRKWTSWPEGPCRSARRDRQGRPHRSSRQGHSRPERRQRRPRRARPAGVRGTGGTDRRGTSRDRSRRSRPLLDVAEARRCSLHLVGLDVGDRGLAHPGDLHRRLARRQRLLRTQDLVEASARSAGDVIDHQSSPRRIFQTSPPRVTTYAFLPMISSDVGWFRCHATPVNPSPVTLRSLPVFGSAGEPGSWPGVK